MKTFKSDLSHKEFPVSERISGKTLRISLIELKSELEIRTLHEKIDHLILHQQQELLELQKVQIEMMSDILKQVENNNGHK